MRLHLSVLRRPRTLIAESGAGDLVKVAGRVRSLGPPLVAPLTGRACVFYRVVVLVEERGVWWTRVDRERRADFLIEDGSGEALVEAEAARPILLDEAAGWSPTSTPALAPLCGPGALDGCLGGWSSRVRHKEVALLDGEGIAVLGRVRRRLDCGRYLRGTPYREPPLEVALEPALPEGLLVTDDPDLW
jgi:hypothetical protein